MSGASEKPWFEGFKWQDDYITSILRWRGLFTNILYGKTWKNGQNRIFWCFEPPKWRFCANFIPYPIGHDARDILDQFWNIEIFALWNGGSSKIRKMAIFDHLEAKIAYFHDYEPFNQVFGANFVPQLKDPNTKDFLCKFLVWSILEVIVTILLLKNFLFFGSLRVSRVQI